MKLIKNSNQDIQSADRFGIARLPYGWLIRLGIQNKVPRFRQIVKDRDFKGDRIKSLREAVRVVSENRHKYESTFHPETNLVKGLGLSKNVNRSGKTFFYRWQISYKDSRRRNKTFGFWNTGKIYEAYLRSVRFCIDLGIEVDLDKIDDYFVKYIQKIESPGFFDRSDIDDFRYEVKRIVIKHKCLWEKTKRLALN